MPATKQRIRWHIAASIGFFLLTAVSGPGIAAPALTATGNDAGWHFSHNTGDREWLELDALRPVAQLAADQQVPADGDLLARLRHSFEFEPTMNARVQGELNWFVRHPDYLQRVLTRAQRYLPYITEVIAARDMPRELALLPIVESAFDPFAYSHGRAAGLWQIIPGTARRFGIRQNWWYDGRRDVIDSTDGALDYLQYLHELLDGDWFLAIAAYNSGEGNVLKAMRRNRAAGKPTDFWNLGLPRETRSYVPRLLALVEIVRDPAGFGLTLPTLDSAPQFAVATTGGQLDLALAAELAGMELATLYQLNSGNNRWATDPAGPHRLLLPVEVADTFSAALAELPADERLRWQRHKVKSGETLSEIAEQYHTTMASIRAANELTRDTIRAGSYLMIPVASRSLSSYSHSKEQRLARTRETDRGGRRIDHVVAAGESFWSIGQRYGVSARKLAAWNGVAPRDTLAIGQTLVVWAAADSPVRATQPVSATTRKLRYTVRNGDSLSLIASRFRVSVSDLVRWNNIDKNNILRPGQKLTMYVDVTRQSG